MEAPTSCPLPLNWGLKASGNLWNTSFSPLSSCGIHIELLCLCYQPMQAQKMGPRLDYCRRGCRHAAVHAACMELA